jgi:hypothetical protein
MLCAGMIETFVTQRVRLQRLISDRSQDKCIVLVDIPSTHSKTLPLLNS